jgi:hypothetical protein
MAARLNPRHSDMVRAKIQASELINILQDHAMGIIQELPNSRMKAIEILLKKSVPDLSAVELTGDPEAPVVMKIITGVPND